MTTRISFVEILRILKPYTRAAGVLVPAAAFIIAASCFAASCYASPAPLKTYTAALGTSTISVESHDQLEHWTARSSCLIGTLHGSAGNLALPGTNAVLTVPLGTLQSGNSSRDHAMYDMFETKQFPTATLTVDSLSGPPLIAGESTAVTFDGSLEMHGLSQRLVRIPATLTYTEVAGSSPKIRLQTTFTIRLKDYRLKAPRFLFIKVAEDQKVTVDMNAVEESSK